MTSPHDSLEMQLRALGRRLEQAPNQNLVFRTRVAAMEAIGRQVPAIERRRRRRLAGALTALFIITLPAPLLFMWVDWTAASALCRSLFPGQVSHAVSLAYLWIKVCGLAMIYGTCVPLLFWVALRKPDNSNYITPSAEIAEGAA